MCAAAKRGVAVAVMVDKGQADGEAGFAGGDSSLTALRLWKGCGVPVYKCKNYAGKVNALHHKNAIFGLSGKRTVWTDTANWSGASMGNGTSQAKPHNARASLIIHDDRLWLRFLSNALQLIRKYAYQQACPYNKPVDNTTVRDNCKERRSGINPIGVQPTAAEVLRQLVTTAGVKAWPMVETTFTVSGLAADTAPTLRYRVNGEAHEHLVHMVQHASGWAATVKSIHLERSWLCA